MGKQDQTKKMDRTADIAASPEGTWSIETFHQAGTTGHATTEPDFIIPAVLPPATLCHAVYCTARIVPNSTDGDV